MVSVDTCPTLRALRLYRQTAPGSFSDVTTGSGLEPAPLELVWIETSGGGA